MKRCPTCQEDFADKFGFCPVDGTPLANEFSAAAETMPTGQASGVGGAAYAATGDTTVTTPPVSSATGGHGANGTNGTESNGVSALPTHAVVAAAGASNDAARRDDEFHLTILEEKGLLSRLSGELRGVAHDAELSWPEFKRNPGGFIKRGASAYGRAFGQFVSQPNVAKGIVSAFAGLLLIAGLLMAFDSLQGRYAISMRAVAFVFVGAVLSLGTIIILDRLRAKHIAAVAGTVVALVGVLSVLLIWTLLGLRGPNTAGTDKVREDLEYVGQVTDIPEEQKKPDEGPAGMNKGKGGGSKPQQEKPGGGGGGGRQEAKPASFGKLPQASLTVPQVVAPDPHPPTIKNPNLPVAATIDADPVLFPPDPRPLPYGDPKSKSTETSSGPGTGNGIGTGTGGGVGSGEGGGVGPGRGGNTGGGDRNEGGGGPGGGGGGTDYSRTFTPREVTRKAVITSKPEPTFTEEARKNNVTGEVILRLVLSSSGQVTNIQPVKRLPDGLTERAIAAARQIQFIPAEKDGRKVSQYVSVVYNFNIY